MTSVRIGQYPALPMQIQTREVDLEDRLIAGVVAPYDEVSYLVPDPGGERILRGAFTRSIQNQHDAGKRRIRLVLGHGSADPAAIGLAESWTDDVRGLTGVFRIREDAEGDQVLRRAADDLYGGLSVEFVPVKRERAKDGVMEVREARLYQVALVGVPAYEGAVLTRDWAKDLLARIGPRPEVNLAPIPAVWTL